MATSTSRVDSRAPNRNTINAPPTSTSSILIPDSTASCPRRSMPSAISFRVKTAMVREVYAGINRSNNEVRAQPLFIHLQHRQKSLLRNLYPADFLHPLLAFLLFLEQFAFA